MGKIILGVIVGFIVWSIIWVGTDALLTTFSPDWYGKNSIEFQKAAESGQPFKTETLMTIFALCLRSCFKTHKGCNRRSITRIIAI